MTDQDFTVFITGASRGLGLEFVRQYLKAGAFVFAAARTVNAPALLELSEAHSERCCIVPLDLTEESCYSAACRIVQSEGRMLDLLIHNAGIYAEGEQNLESIQSERMQRVLFVDAVSPLLLTRALLPVLRRPGAIITALTSGAGLLRNNLVRMTTRAGGQFSYGMGKAALHKAWQVLASDPAMDGCTVVGMAPGFVLTDMTRGVPTPPTLEPPESVRGMIATLAGLGQEANGGFYDYTGSRCEWEIGK